MYTVSRPFDAVSWMWDEALTALERAENRHRRFFALLGTRAPRPAWEPPADVFETNDAIWVLVALPGIRIEHVTVSVSPTELFVQTQRMPASAPASARVRRMEIPYGVFERRIQLPQGSYTLQEHRMVDGCLELCLVKE
jgi:HSP20 family protein